MIVACVRVGVKYGPEYADRLQRAILRHLPVKHDFICIREEGSSGLPGWWAKMALFDPDLRGGERLIYFDLDTVICGDLSPLAELDCEFGICENFTRLAGNTNWPCHFGSCVMTFAPGFGGDIFEAFCKRRLELMRNPCGDQKVIEDICAELGYEPTLLQRVLPPGFFVGYRDLPKHQTPPKGCSVVVFAGSHKPHNTDCAWAREAWAA